MASKLPDSLTESCNREASKIRRHHRKEPDQRRGEMLMSDPLFSREALSEFNTLKERPARQSKIKDFLTLPDGKAAVHDQNDKKQPPLCPLCNSSHDLDECRNFHKMEAEGRTKFLSQQKLCYWCYKKISKLYTAYNCPIRRTCKICAGKHPIGIHGFKLKRKGDNSASNDDKTLKIVKSNCTNISNNTQCAAIGSGQVLGMCVVPEKVQHMEINKEITGLPAGIIS